MKNKKTKKKTTRPGLAKLKKVKELILKMKFNPGTMSFEPILPKWTKKKS
ncbi:MAG: hypothetical protein U1B79_01835 [Candidatus Pacearchaeota archaeon]|nr:hypothetical protein [Nanoarchaeota archaeon]MDZ4226826.1 hypothetical protein [Candidatus Pacearchaeota archaeon]